MAVEHRGPVRTVHVLAPVEVAHQAAVVVEHLTPHRPRVDRATQPGQVDRDARRVVVLDLGRGRYDEELVLDAQHDPLAVAGHLERLAGAEDGDGARVERVPLQNIGLGVTGDARASRAELAGGRDDAAPHDTVLRGPEVLVLAGRDGERYEPLLEPVDVEVGGRGHGRLRSRLGALRRCRRLGLHLADRPAVGGGAERRGGGGGERYEVGADRAGERQVEPVLVVAGVERAGR